MKQSWRGGQPWLWSGVGGLLLGTHHRHDAPVDAAEEFLVGLGVDGGVDDAVFDFGEAGFLRAARDLGFVVGCGHDGCGVVAPFEAGEGLGGMGRG